MNDQERLYIKLENPNNVYEDGKLVFESSLNMSVNFRVFTCNPLFAQFKGKVYVDVQVEMSDEKKWLVDKLSARLQGASAQDVALFNAKFAEVAGCGVDELGSLDPATAWLVLNKLVKEPLPYGKLLTDRQYTPTPVGEREGFECKSSNNKWTFREAPGWNDPIFEVEIDEYGRPIFRFRPDTEGMPATMECLLTDLETFLFENRNSTGEWLINTVFPEKRRVQKG